MLTPHHPAQRQRESLHCLPNPHSLLLPPYSYYPGAGLARKRDPISYQNTLLLSFRLSHHFPHPAMPAFAPHPPSSHINGHDTRCRKQSRSTASWRSRNITRIAAGLTCLQFLFALYATSLFFFDPSFLIKHYLQPQASKDLLCSSEEIPFEQKTSNDSRVISMKKALYGEILQFQQRARGCETLKELLELPSQALPRPPKVTVILNHFKRKTLCAQIDALLAQTCPFHKLWVVAFNSPNEKALRATVDAYNDTRMSFISSSYDFKYYGRFQLALQVEGADYVYILDDDMIPGKKMLHILTHAARTTKYKDALLGSIGRILPFRQKDFTFPSYRQYGAKEAGIYLPDPAYKIIVEHVLQVDFLLSAWFLPASLVKSMFIESPSTFATGEDIHLSYQLQKYKGAGSFVMPVDPNDKDTWGDTEHRLAYISETTVNHKSVVQLRDSQWWAAMSRGFVTQWALMHPQRSDAIFYAHSLTEVVDLAPLIRHFRSTPGRKAYVAVSGGPECPCEQTALILKWPPNACYERRFKIFDLQITSRSSIQHNVTLLQQIVPSMKGLLKIHSPTAIITVANLHPIVAHALSLTVEQHSTVLIQLPRLSIPLSLWMANLRPSALQQWNKMKISINVVTQNRPASLQRLLRSITRAHYLGDEISLSFNIDSGADGETTKTVGRFSWPHGSKLIRHRVVHGGLIRAVSESWYPTNDDDHGLILEDDTEVSPFFYIWLKYTLLTYRYSPDPSLPELMSIALYTPRLIEVVPQRPHWNATDHFKDIHPNTPYLHQLPCSWGALFFPRHWREFYHYMAERYTWDAKQNPVQIPNSRTNGWQASWKKFLIDLMYLRGYVTLYPNFPNQSSFSTNHMEPGAHINAADNKVNHRIEDFEVPLMMEDFIKLLPGQKLPSVRELPVINLFNQRSSLKGLKAAGAKMGQDVLPCNPLQTVVVDGETAQPLGCTPI